MEEERKQLEAEKKQAEKKVEALCKEQKELQTEMLRIIREEIPELEAKSGALLRNGGDYEDVNDLIGKRKRQARSMDVSIGQKENELTELRRKIEVIEGELAKLPEEPEEITEPDRKEI